MDLAVVGATLSAFGSGATYARGGAFHPFAFLPDLHGGHFHDALRRLLSVGGGPFVVHLSVTGSCPWSCRYCFASAGGPSAPEPTDADLDRIARALAARRVPIVILSGGEPLGRFERVLRLTKLLAPGCEVRLATSGAGLSASRAASLREAGLRVLAISLDSSARASVDATRGEGAFDTAERALSIASEAGLFTLVTSVVGRGAFRDASELERFLRRVAARHPGAVVNFLPEFATGRGSARGFRSPADFAPLGALLTRAVRRGRHRAGVFYASPMDTRVGCVGAAQKQLTIDARGELLACVSRASFGNLCDEPFDAVWARMLAAPSRYKQGYFCAHVAEQGGPDAPLDPVATRAALERFFAGTPDAALQRVAELVGPWLA